MNNYKVAVVLSGHARMVPQGDRLHRQSFALAPNVAEWQRFSYCWSADSEVRPPNVEQQQQFDLRDRILLDMGHRHCYADQKTLFDQLCTRFINQGALPDYRTTKPAVANQIRYHFGKYLGQLLGFTLAVDRWRDELKKYDFIVRTRWDHALDPVVLDDLSKDFFYTKSINIWDGRPIISGDNIYGSTDKWLKLIPSTEDVIKRIIQACRRLRSELAVKQPTYNFAQDFQWYTTHYLWYVLIENEPISLLHRGESYGLNYEISKIPLEELTLDHAAYGIERYLGNLNELPSVIKDQTVADHRREKNDAMRIINQRRLERQRQLEEKIKSQNLR